MKVLGGVCARRVTATALTVALTAPLTAVLTACAPSAAPMKVATRSVTSSVGSGAARTSPAPGTVWQHVEQVSIPSSDGFAARPAYVYVPPSTAHDTGRVPVLELLHGTPGGPSDWLRLGALVSTMDAFAARHGGEAPLVVMPDENGTQHGDSECIRTATGQDTESYLTTDVVRWVRSHYAHLVGRGRWWIAGLSEGGLCSLMLALRHPGLYSTFGDFSGFDAPVVDHLDRAESDRQLYGDSTAARLSHQPLWLLRHHRYPTLRGWFDCGDRDAAVLSQTRAAAAAASAASAHVRLTVVTGGHTWLVWQQALRSFLPWAWGDRR